MSSFVAVCFLGVATFLLGLQLSIPRADFEDLEDFDDDADYNSWISMCQKFLILLMAVILVPLAMIVLQQRNILYRPIVAGRRVSIGHKSNPAAWGLEHEGFFLSSRDGTKLNAWLLYPQKGAQTKRPALLFFHSNAGDIPQRLDFFSQLCRQLNVVILAMEYRGFGRSADGGISEKSFVEDAACAYNWLVNYASTEKSCVDPARLFIFGRSLGGCVAVRLLTFLLGASAGSNCPEEMRRGADSAGGPGEKQPLPLPAGVLIENSPSCIADMAMHLMPFLRILPRRLLSWPVLLDEWRSNDWLNWIGSALSSQKKSLRICLLSAAHDKELRDVGGKHKSLDISFHSFQRGEHMSTYLLAGDRYWQALRNFIN